MLDQNYKLLQSNKSCIKQLIQFLALCQEKKLCLLIACDEFSGCHESFYIFFFCVAKITLNEKKKKKKKEIPSTPL